MRQGPELKRWLFKSALPVWWEAGADHQAGGFHDALDGQARPIGALRRVRVQARQTYVFAVAGGLGWDGPWRDAVEHGLDYLFRRSLGEEGLFHDRGRAAPAPPLAYDQAFVLLALARSAAALPHLAKQNAERAERLWLSLQSVYGHAAGGVREAAGSTAFLANPNMHLFEACLEWTAILPGGAWRTRANQLAGLGLTRFFDPARGSIAEVYDAAWAPAPAGEARLVEPGHQFEWAWLLDRWRDLCGGDPGDVPARLVQRGEAGVVRGLALNSLDGDGVILDAGARLWPQTERLRAAARFAAQEALKESRETVGRFLDTPGPGLWRDARDADGRFIDEPARASSLYHLVTAIAELDAQDRQA